MIEQTLNNLVRGNLKELPGFISEVEINKNISGTKTISHVYHVSLDGNGRPRTTDFVEFIATKLLEYSIPRSEVAKAKKYLNDYDSPSKISELIKKAENLFTHLKNSGEGGELLLYVLVQEYLKIPQLLCKMPLKTNKQMHYHGVDGIHATFDASTKFLELYWGESKLYKDLASGIEECFKSLKGFLLSPGGSTAPQDRDITLIKDNLDLNDKDLEDALVQYFDKGNAKFNQLRYNGVCLIGFNSDKYPIDPNTLTNDKLTALIKAEVKSWVDNLKTEIGKHQHLDTFVLHVFLIPFPSVEEFRKEFLRVINVPVKVAAPKAKTVPKSVRKTAKKVVKPKTKK